ncbi:MAG TPA: nuclear transport factor 2 family protein [Bryobacteraceae bacterium]|nr:nuclear transport factor 2 family protein [Bryobacteraceae bacterium]
MTPVEQIRALYDAFSRGDVPAVTGCFHDNITWNYPGKPPYAAEAPYIGCDSIVNNVFVRLADEFESFQSAPLEFIASGNKVVVICRETGLAKKTGAPFDIEAVHLWTVENERVTAVSVYTDTLQFAKVAGFV